MAVRMTDRRSITGEDNNLAEEAGSSVTFLLPYSLAYSGDRTA